jgi:acyl carrier protein
MGADRISIEIVCAATADILQVPQPGEQDSFFGLGGSSLDAVRLAARIERSTRIRLDPGQIIASKTLAEVAGLLDEAAPEPACREKAAPANGEETSPRSRSRASMAQQWSLDAARLAPQAPPLQFQVAYRVTGPFGLTAFSGALEAVVRHHHALRVVMRREGDHDEMVVEEPQPMVTTEVAPASGEARLAFLTSFARRPFDAAHGPRVRALVLRAGEDEHDLCLAFDHRVADGWSLRIVLEDLSTAYAQMLDGTAVRLPPAGSYLDYAEDEWATAPGRVARAASYWSTVLPGKYSEFPLPLPGHRASFPLTDPRHVRIPLPPAAADSLKTVAESAGQTTFAVATAAAARAVAQLTGRGEVRILTSSANRGHAGHDRTVGWFANGVFPSYAVTDHPSTAALVRHVSDTVARAAQFGDVPAAYVRTSLWPDAPSGFRQDTGIYLAVNDSWDAPPVLRGCRLCPIEIEDRADAPGIQLYLFREDTSWVAHAYFHASEYAPTVVHELAGTLIQMLIRQLPESS